MARKQRPTPSAADLLRRLEQRYSVHQPPATPQWAVFREVRVPRPEHHLRWRSVDAVAVGLWESNRHAIHGFEVKISRSDWLQELRESSKAEAGARFCNYWWLVAADQAIVRDDLPPGWGLLVPFGASKLRAVVQPTYRPAESSPEFTAQLLTRALLQRGPARAHGYHEGFWKGWKRAADESEARYWPIITRLHRELEAHGG